MNEISVWPRPPHEVIGAGAALEDVVAVDGVERPAADQRIVAFAADQIIAAAVAGDEIVAVTAEQLVVASVADQEVVAGAAVQ